MQDASTPPRARRRRGRLEPSTHFARLLPVHDTKQPRHLEEQNAITGDGSGAWRCRALLHRRHGHPPRPRERTKSCEHGCGRRGCKTRQCERASQAQDANAPDPSIGFLAQLRDCCDLVPPSEGQPEDVEVPKGRRQVNAPHFQLQPRLPQPEGCRTL